MQSEGVVPTWEVTIKLGLEERVYKFNFVTRYEAITNSLEDFLKEFSLPGRPYEYWSGNSRSGILEVSASNSMDRRRMRKK